MIVSAIWWWTLVLLRRRRRSTGLSRKLFQSLKLKAFLCCWPTQLRAAIVSDDPGEDGILWEVVAAAVGQVVEVEKILIVAQMATLPLQHVTLCSVFCHVVLWAKGKTLLNELVQVKVRPICLLLFCGDINFIWLFSCSLLKCFSWWKEANKGN